MGLTKPRAYQIYDIDYKQATRVATTTNITLSGGTPNQVDGVNLSVNDRVLVTGQSSGKDNGIYFVQTVGSGSNGTWVRSIDTDQSGELLAGTIVMVTEGNTYADTQWKLITNDPIVIGTSSLTFIQNFQGPIITSGTSNVAIYSPNSNVTMGVNGTGNVVIVANTGQYVSGVVSASGNVSGNYLLANIYYATGFSASRIYSGNSEVNVSSSGSNINVSVSGTPNVAVFAPTGEYVTGIVSVSGNILTGSQISATGNVNANYLLGNIYYATGFSASRIYNGNSEVNVATSGSNVNVSVGGTSNVVVFAPTGEYVSGIVSVSGNIYGGNIINAGISSVTGNMSAGNILTAGILSASGNTIGGNLLTGGLVSATGNIIAGAIRYPNTDGTPNQVLTAYGNGVAYWAAVTAGAASQIANGTSNITIPIASTNVVVGVAGTPNVAVFTSNSLSVAGNITGSYILGNGALLSGLTPTKIFNGNSEANIGVANGNLAITISAVSNVMIVSTNTLIMTGAHATPKTITANLSTAANINGTMFGPITLANNVNITVDPSSVLYIYGG